MAIAVVNHADLVKHANELGFPLHTKVSCQSGMIGYVVWNNWIRDNVQWVSELGHDPIKHVKITESAQLVGELKQPWELRCQKYVEGSEESNPFRPIQVDGEEFSLHVNRQAIQVVVSNASLRYKIDFETEADGAVVTHNKLAVAIFDSAEDTSISYQSDLEVAQLWTTKVEHHDVVVGSSIRQPWLYKRAYAEDPTQEATYPWIIIGKLDAAEYDEWVKHNVVKEVDIQEVASDVSKRLSDAFTKAKVETVKSPNPFGIESIYKTYPEAKIIGGNT